MRKAIVFLFILAAQLWCLAGVGTKVVDLPHGPVTRVASGDRKWTLVFECPNDCSTRKLWIERQGRSDRRFVKDFERSLSISWSPNSRLFFVNDFYASNAADCHIYDPVTLKSTEVADLLVAGDGRARKYLKAGHSYLDAERWINSNEILVRLHGHFDEPPARGFSLKYRLDVNGRVQKLSESPRENP